MIFSNHLIVRVRGIVLEVNFVKSQSIREIYVWPKNGQKRENEKSSEIWQFDKIRENMISHTK